MQRTFLQQTPHDVSRKSTRFLRGLLDNLGEALIVRREADQELVYVSSSISETLGVTTEEFATGQHSWLTGVPDADLHLARKAVRRERGGVSPGETEFRIVGVDGAERWLNWRTRALDITEEQFLVTAIRDVSTERRERDDLRDQALRDPLTGLWNRRGLDEMVAHELSRTRRTGESVSAILIDVDDFKSVNDRFGHVAGDRVLCGVASAIRRTVRPCDPAGRIGGDEFLVLLPGASVGEASQIAERIRRAIEREPGPARASATLGVALVHDDDVTVDTALRRTQAVLTRGKRAGKNRVEHIMSAGEGGY